MLHRWKLEFDVPRIALVVNQLSKGGEQLYQDLFKRKPVESEWTRLTRNEPDERTILGVLFLIMDAPQDRMADADAPGMSSEKNPVAVL